MIRFLAYALLPSLLLLTWSCAKDPAANDGDRNGKEIRILFNLGLPPDGTRSAGTRSLSADDAGEEVQIDAVDVLAFVKTSDGKFRYSYAATDISRLSTDTEVEVVATVKKYPGEQIFLILCNAADEVAAAGIRPNEEIDVAMARIKCGADDAGEWPAKINGSATFVPFPMYAKTTAQVISDSNKEIGDFPLVRMIARVDVTLGAAVSNFTLVNAQVYNRTVYGFVPYDFSAWNSGSNRVTAAAVPTDNAFPGRPDILTPTVVYAAANTGAAVDTRGEIKRSIYLFESKGVTGADRLTGTAIIVGGRYSGSNDVTYYRIDIATDATPQGYVSQDILRNHHYQIEIQAVATPGSGTPDQAYRGEVTLTVNVTVADWEDVEQNGGI